MAVAACWIAAAGWGLYYLIVLGGSNPAYVAVAVVHFIVGFFLARGLMAQPMTIRTALAATFAAGVFTRIAIGFPTPEFWFAPLGPLAALGLSDVTERRNVGYSLAAFALGFVAVIWLGA